ncbi:MAG: hypothetical protein HOC74_36935 [Gemmatimonadetes bacterium]|jgi:hypothetical protein|nr:hypothetical protein [Gemmatimonadota bacterium]
MGAWELLVPFLFLLLYVGIPATLIYVAVRGYKNLMEQFEQIRVDIQGIREQLEQIEREKPDSDSTPEE